MDICKHKSLLIWIIIRYGVCVLPIWFLFIQIYACTIQGKLHNSTDSDVNEACHKYDIGLIFLFPSTQYILLSVGIQVAYENNHLYKSLTLSYLAAFIIIFEMVFANLFINKMRDISKEHDYERTNKATLYFIFLFIVFLIRNALIPLYVILHHRGLCSVQELINARKHRKRVKSLGSNPLLKPCDRHTRAWKVAEHLMKHTWVCDSACEEEHTEHCHVRHVYRLLNPTVCQRYCSNDKQVEVSDDDIMKNITTTLALQSFQANLKQVQSAKTKHEAHIIILPSNSETSPTMQQDKETSYQGYAENSVAHVNVAFVKLEGNDNSELKSSSCENTQDQRGIYVSIIDEENSQNIGLTKEELVSKDTPRQVKDKTHAPRSISCRLKESILAKDKEHFFDSNEQKEAYLFHGAPIKNILGVIDIGFDIRKSMRCPFGKGIYFAECSNKADQYTSKRSNRYKENHTLIIARVRLGKLVHRGSENEAQANTIVAGLDSRFREFVVKDPKHIYPAFVVVYDVV